MKDFDYAKARQFLEKKERDREKSLDERFNQASNDFQKIIKMKAESNSLTFESKITRGISSLKKIYHFYNNYVKTEYDSKARRIDQAIVISDLICSYYNCLETIFLQVSHFFENSLNNEKWHHDLLHKMRLQINGIRNAIISNETYYLLIELLSFRDFMRYEFELEYDWDNLDFIQKKFQQVNEMAKKDLSEFLSTNLHSIFSKSRSQDMTEKLNEIYEKESSIMDPNLMKMQVLSLKGDTN